MTTFTNLAKKYGTTIEKIRDEHLAFLNGEGYDDHGNCYDTFDQWMLKKPCKVETRDPEYKSDIDGDEFLNWLTS